MRREKDGKGQGHMQMRMSQEGEILPEMLHGDGKDEVVTGLEYKDGIYGSTSQAVWEHGLVHEILTKPSVAVIFDGLPDSGKSTAISQQASRLDGVVHRLNALGGTRRKLKYAGWSSFLLSKLGNDPQKFGTLTIDQLISYSLEFGQQAEQLLAEDETIALLEVPGGAERGSALIDTLVPHNNVFKLTIWSDEDLRRDKKEFRRKLHTISTAPELAILLEEFQIEPNVPVSLELLRILQANGATVKGIEAVDADVDEEMIPNIRNGKIKLYAPFVDPNELSDDEIRNSLDMPFMRTTAIGQYYGLLNEVRYRLPPGKVFIGFNADQGKVNLRRDILDDISVKFDNGKMIL